ncbi:glycosyltransferase [Staphylothermus hellenicus]|uniref:Glycosyl transferase family 1 domain-containing protein n=1 Tax=Staphylothermus hellenicus (strain DSM 12710 / JCM 10830 / BK20S6-10-b1 / P8) TaxID=591019 RepID=D7DA07_STAHD|nr:glycosyltransferase [Staphylothermus hellenicus]ADI32603.1 hypothetical protein Shell_1515 [Staphylothermus hellenicus DSM 12710]
MKTVFLAWGRIGRRTVELSRELGSYLLFIPDKPPYLKAYFKTIKFLSRFQPKTVILQLPQGPLLFSSIMHRKKHHYNVVADVHTGFSIYDSWKSLILNKPFHCFLKYCELVIAHNDPFREYLVKTKGLDPERVVTVYDPFPKIPENPRKPINIDVEPFKYIVFPAAWDPDENLEFIVREYLSSTASRTYKLLLTGNYNRRKRLAEKIRRSSDKIVLTGYVGNREYYWILKYSKLVVTGTTREYTMLSSIWESLALEKPFITSYTYTLGKILGKNTLYYTYKEGSLRKLLDTCLNNNACLVYLRKRITTLKENMKTLSRNSIEKLRIIINRLNEL